MASFIITAAIMFGFWILLSGFFDLFHITAGIVCSLLVSYFSHDLLIGNETRALDGVKRVLRFFKYLPWLIYEILKANIGVAVLTLHPRMPIDPRMITVNTNLKTEMGIVTFANSITLTPGTVTVGASSEGKFLVHVIEPGAAAILDNGEMARRVKEIEGDV